MGVSALPSIDGGSRREHDFIVVRRAPALSAIDPVHADRHIVVKQQELPVPDVTDDDVRAYIRRWFALEVECAAPSVVIWEHTGKARGS